MHHYPFHPGDYQLSTNHWSEERKVVQCEEGLLRDLAYRRLIDLYYSLEAPIPDKTHWVATRIRMVAHIEIVGSVLKEKFVREAGLWRNDKCDSEIARYQKRVDSNRKNGQLGGRKPSGLADGNRVGSKPRTKNQNHTVDGTAGPDGPASSKRGMRIPEGWQPNDADLAYIRSRRPELDPVETADAFRDYWMSLAGAKGCKLDWSATWRTWVRNQHASRKGGPLQADQPGAWWSTRQGLLDKGIELQIPAPADDHPESFRRFKASVWMAAGEGPWWDDKDTAYALAVKLRNGGI